MVRSLSTRRSPLRSPRLPRQRGARAKNWRAAAPLLSKTLAPAPLTSPPALPRPRPRHPTGSLGRHRSPQPACRPRGAQAQAQAVRRSSLSFGFGGRRGRARPLPSLSLPPLATARHHHRLLWRHRRARNGRRALEGAGSLEEGVRRGRARTRERDGCSQPLPPSPPLARHSRSPCSSTASSFRATTTTTTRGSILGSVAPRCSSAGATERRDAERERGRGSLFSRPPPLLRRRPRALQTRPSLPDQPPRTRAIARGRPQCPDSRVPPPRAQRFLRRARVLLVPLPRAARRRLSPSSPPPPLTPLLAPPSLIPEPPTKITAWCSRPTRSSWTSSARAASASRPSSATRRRSCSAAAAPLSSARPRGAARACRRGARSAGRTTKRWSSTRAAPGTQKQNTKTHP